MMCFIIQQHVESAGCLSLTLEAAELSDQDIIKQIINLLIVQSQGCRGHVNQKTEKTLFLGV